MAQLQTQLYQLTSGPGIQYSDSQSFLNNRLGDVRVMIEKDSFGNLTFSDYDTSNSLISPLENIPFGNTVNNVATRVNGDSFNLLTAVYTFAEGQPNRFLTATIESNPTPQPTPSTDINTGMGDAYYEEDLTTNVKKYFAEAFKFDGSQFEMDGDRIVGLKQSFIDSLATDLTNIVNTSIRTATLEADMATINQTLTALGINTDLLKTKDLRLVDADGHEHKLHLGN